MQGARMKKTVTWTALDELEMRLLEAALERRR
jgi:hypothetical protein